MRDRAAFVWAAFRRGRPSLWKAIGLGFLVVGGSIVAAVPAALGQPVLAAGIVVAAAAYTFGEGSYRLLHDSRKQLEESATELRAFEAQAPRLSFGKAILPEQSQPIGVFLPEMGGQPKAIGTGRIIRVPVTNERGAREAHQVHARLTFMPDDRDGSFSPRYPAQGEWFSESGPEIEINLPGNGRPRMIDVLLVLDGEYPHAHEWTTASRHAALRGYEIKANRVEVEIEVMGSGPEPTAPYLHDTLIVELNRGHMIHAAWASATTNEATNWVAWSGRPLRGWE